MNFNLATVYSTLPEQLADGNPTPEEALAAKDDAHLAAVLKTRLRAALGSLSQLELDVLVRRQASAIPEETSQVATLHGITTEDVVRIEASALKTLRSLMGRTELAA
jgi:DNA-directed RNA polymerase sigma subunit (sigma70/sigma32)